MTGGSGAGLTFGHRRNTTTTAATAGDEDLTTVAGKEATEAAGTGIGADAGADGAEEDSAGAGAPTTPRLWSNLNVQQAPFRHAPGSLPGAIALVAGTTVGAGMLALPAVCQNSGFVPSTVALSGCWVYMIATGLLVLEVNLSTMCELGSGGVSIISMAERTLGKPGTRFAWGAYVFIHYALLVAYISRSGEIVSDALGGAIPAPVAAVVYAATLGGFIYAAPSNLLERFNNTLVAVVLGTFLPLLLIAGSAVEPTNLVDHSQWGGVPNTIPVIALAFVFHNVIPVVAATLEGDRNKIQTALLAGTSIPFVMFVLWDAAVLGSVSAKDAAAAAAMVAAGGSVADPLATLRGTSATAAALVQGFSFFAISTSFLGFVLGLTDFLADGLQLSTGSRNDPRPFLIALVPPTIFAISYPDIFLSALDSAGTFGVLTLFGCMPPMMAWSNRYGLFGSSKASLGGGMVVEPLVPGGKLVLGGLFSLAALVVVGETVEKLLVLVDN